jgi:putative oxidoreductase
MTARRVILLVLSILLGIFFALQGVVKLIGAGGWVHRFRAWGYPDHFSIVVGAAELAGAILLVIPKTRTIGALLLMVIMLGATATHVLHHEPQVMTTVVVFVLLAVLAFAGKIAPRG